MIITFINEEGCVARKVSIAKNSPKKSNGRDWFFVRFAANRIKERGIVIMGKQEIYTPKRYIGKRVRFKVEIVERGFE